MLTGELQKEKNGFQAAIPETPRSAARVKIKQARKRIAKVRAGYSKIQPLQGLDTTGGAVEQKNSCFRDWRTQLIRIGMLRRSEKLAPAGEAATEVSATNSKGCDIGYALAANSCEGVNNVDACTVTALDATTAFAVPDPTCPSQGLSVFSGPGVHWIAPLNLTTQSTSDQPLFILTNPFDRQRARS